MGSLDNIVKKGLHLNGYGAAARQRDYLVEIERAVEQRNPKEKGFPFVNQERTLIEILQKLNSAKPYVVLIGQPGNGKSLIMDYIKSVLTDEISIDEVHSYHPRASGLFKDLKKKLKRFQSREHIFLPNLIDPTRPLTASYIDPTEAEREYDVAEEFSNNVANFLTELIGRNKDKMKKSMGYKEYLEYAQYEIEKFYSGLYLMAQRMIQGITKKNGPKDSTASCLDIILGEDPDTQAKVKWNFLHITEPELLYKAAGIKGKPESGTVDQYKIEEGLATKIIASYINKRLYTLIDSISSFEIEGEKEPWEIFSRLFAEFNDYQKQELLEGYSEGTFKNAQDITEKFSLQGIMYLPKFKPSQETKKYISECIEEIVEEYESTDLHPKIQKFMRIIKEYFNPDNKEIDIALKRIFNTDIYEEEFYKVMADSEDNNKKDKCKKEERDKAPKMLSFELFHGKEFCDIRNILNPHVLRGFGSSKGVSYNKLQTFDTDTIFGEYLEEADDRMPPHLRIMNLGIFFKGGILEIRDSFSTFIKEIASGEEGYEGLKEASLEFLETGIMRWTCEGITYELECPCAIIGSDNEDPFIRVQNFIQEKDEPGLRSRIKTIKVPSFVENSPTVRKGTLEVIIRTVDRWNKENEVDMKISSEALNHLLISTIWCKNYADLSYRDLENKVEDLLSFTRSKRRRVINLDILKRKAKEDIPLAYFIYADQEDNFGGYFDMPQKRVGQVCGLSVSGDMSPGSLFKLTSTFVAGIDEASPDKPRFEFSDIDCGLTEETTYKGFQLTESYVRNVITKAGINYKQLKEHGDWKVLTYEHGHWSPWGGPSASAGIAISIISAIADDEVYKNRFITGTLDAATGNIGQIGGTYLKGLIPYRLKQTAKKKGDYTPIYFLFPVENLNDLIKDSVLDPFHWQEHIAGIPVRDFAEAYHLCTCGPVITESDIKEAPRLGQKKMEEVYKKIKARFS
jgi:hypothetical protein